MKMYTNNPELIKVARTAFPGYTGKKFAFEILDHPINVKSCWSGGSKDEYVFVRLDNLTTMEMPPQSAFDAKVAGAEAVTLIPGLACVRHVYFCGKDLGVTVLLHQDNKPALIEKQVDLSDNEKIVLVYTRSLKPSYGGISNYRFHEAHREKQISLEDWEAAKANLIGRGLLNKAGAITDAGRNASNSLRK